MAKFIVTPWEVKGKIDYDKLIKQFGTERIDKALLQRIEKYTGELHPMLRRGVFFSHRDLKWVFDQYDKGNKFVLYTGRGPSGKVHLGHLLPWYFTKHLQDKFKCKLYFQMTDDEKFLFKKNLTLEEANEFAHENALDVIATGFDPKMTYIFTNSEVANDLYPTALKVAKKVTFSTAKAVFGFTNESNIGQIFYTAMQSVPCFLESIKQKKNVPCLIPYAIDQDPHFRVTRDIAEKLGYYKPAAIHSIFLPGLGEGGKMSSSEEHTCIFTTDTPKEVKKKVGRAFTGGRSTVDEQRAKGGRPEICTVFEYLYTFFEPDDEEVMRLRKRCQKGGLLCGECKAILTEKIQKFLAQHQKRREKAKSKLKQFMKKK